MQENAALLVLENDEGKVVRTFHIGTPSAHIIQRQDTRRLELVPSIEHLKKNNIKFTELGLIEKGKLAHLDFAVAGGGKIRLAQQEATLQKDVVLEQDRDKESIIALILTLAMGLIFGLAMTQLEPMGSQKLEQELKQQIVQIAKKIPTQKQETVSNVSENKTKEVKKTNLKRMGALFVLGSLKNSKQKGGLNLNAVHTTAGPGLGGTGGSGGVQTTIYAKGLVGAPLGAGANVQGGGGYGTKGKGGGQSGYGTMSLVGAKGSDPVPLSSEATTDGGLDMDLIAAVVMKNMGQIRFCYEQALQGDPNLAGRVAMGWVIGGNGMVKSANVENTTLNSKLVEDCITLRLRSWKFPLPAGGVDVKVSFPFVLRRTGQG